MPFTPGDDRSIPFTTTQEQQPESFGIPANTAVMAAYFQIIEARLAALESQMIELTS